MPNIKIVPDNERHDSFTCPLKITLRLSVRRESVDAAARISNA
ncbi:hypothetical protein [Methylomonas methanica]|nr:hypothetical protein [Methylomonas methanica]